MLGNESEGDIGIESKYLRHLMMNETKKGVLITSRVHPGETQSSFALEGIV